MLRVILLDRFDQPIGELSESEVFGLVLDETVNGEHSLTITTTAVLEKGWRVLTKDHRGRWREHVVYGTDALHDSGERPFGTYYCTWSVQPDLMGTRISKMPGVQTPVAAGVALEDVLDGTSRWQVGTVTNTNTGGASMYDTDGWSAMSTLIATWGGEVDTTIEVGDSGIAGRKVDLYAQQGEQAAKRRYDFGADIASVRRKVEDGPLYCRVTPRGRGEETEGGGYGRKITIESVNDGKDYLENPDMVPLAKLPDGSGGWEYPTIEIENPDCETPADLKAWAQSVLVEYTAPKVTYEVDVLQLAREGVDMHGVSLGDAVQVVDRKFGDGVRISRRVLRKAVNLLDEADEQITLGELGGSLADMIGSLDARLAQATETVQAMNGGTMSTADYLSRLLDRINAEINADGGYTYITEGEGLRTYDAAVSDPLVGAEASKVVEVKGGTIRIADSKTAQGEWEWKTVFTSGHILAELVTAANLTAGYIGAADSGNYWNLDTGELRMAATAEFGSSTVQDVLDAVDSSITEVDVEYAQGTSTTTAPTTGWSTTAPAWEAGKYIWQRTKTVSGGGTSYSEPTCISGRDGQTGTNAATIMLYKRASSQPSTSGIGTLTYTFATSTLSGNLDGWTQGVPDGTATCWVIMATAISNSVDDTIDNDEWSEPVQLSTAGVDGLNQATVFLFQRKRMWRTEAEEMIAPAGALSFSGSGATAAGAFSGENLVLASEAPAKPSAAATYTFATGVLSPIPTGWYRSVPDGEDPVWVTTAAAISNAASTTVAANDWATPVVFSERDDGVTVYSVKYAVGTSGTTAPTSGWQSTVPSTAQGEWLWCRTTYTDNSTADTCSYMGTDGEDGISVVVQSVTKVGSVTTVILADSDGNTSTLTIEDGEDGDNGTPGENGYVHVAWATSADGTEGFSTSVSDGKTYIGVYTDHTSADSQNPADYSWSKIKGETGATGTGVSAVVEQYYLSTSSTTQTGGSWSTTQPAWQSGRYIWTRSQVTWTSGSVTTTTPVLAKAINSANEGASSAQAAVTSLDSSLDQQGVFNRLTNNGAAQGVYIENGQLYINGTYMVIGKISSQNGRVYFDLTNNELACNKLWAPQPGTTVGDVVLTARNTAQYAGSYFTFLNIYNTQKDTDAIRIHPARGSYDSAITTIDSNLLIAAKSDSPDGRGATKGGLLQLKANEASLTAYPSGSSFTNAYVYCSGTQNCVLLGTVRAGTTQCAQLTVTGSKSRLVETDGYSDRLLYCDETPSPTFTDFGSGTIGADGLCYVEIDAIFAETVRTDMAYQVFLQQCGSGELWVHDKMLTHFIVKGTPGLAFDWQLKAHQTGFETLRLEDNALSEAIVPEELPNPEDAYGDYISEIEQLLVE